MSKPQIRKKNSVFPGGIGAVEGLGAWVCAILYTDGVCGGGGGDTGSGAPALEISTATTWRREVKPYPKKESG